MIARESRYGANFMARGITPGMGMTRLLETVLSTAVAHELLYAADLRRGGSFAGCSAFNAILPRAELVAHARALAWTIAEHDRDNLRLLKRTLTLPRRRALQEALTMEALMHEASLARLDTTAMA
jgi:polyketide biosynthesis enoyl-CoA hydratase PksI